MCCVEDMEEHSWDNLHLQAGIKLLAMVLRL